MKSVPVLAVVVSVGALAPGHLTVAGHGAVREPVASCINSRSRWPTLPGAVNVKVQLPVRVIF